MLHNVSSKCRTTYIKRQVLSVHFLHACKVDSHQSYLMFMRFHDAYEIPYCVDKRDIKDRQTKKFADNSPMIRIILSTEYTGRQCQYLQWRHTLNQISHSQMSFSQFWFDRRERHAQYNNCYHFGQTVQVLWCFRVIFAGLRTATSNGVASGCNVGLNFWRLAYCLNSSNQYLLGSIMVKSCQTICKMCLASSGWNTASGLSILHGQRRSVSH